MEPRPPPSLLTSLDQGCRGAILEESAEQAVAENQVFNRASHHLAEHLAARKECNEFRKHSLHLFYDYRHRRCGNISVEGNLRVHDDEERVLFRQYIAARVQLVCHVVLFHLRRDLQPEDNAGTKHRRLVRNCGAQRSGSARAVLTRERPAVRVTSGLHQQGFLGPERNPFGFPIESFEHGEHVFDGLNPNAADDRVATFFH